MEVILLSQMQYYAYVFGVIVCRKQRWYFEILTLLFVLTFWEIALSARHCCSPYYGYHRSEEPFLKIYLYNPLMVKKSVSFDHVFSSAFLKQPDTILT